MAQATGFAELFFYGAALIVALIIVFMAILAIMLGLIAGIIFVQIWWVKVLCAAILLGLLVVIYYRVIK